MVTKKIELPIEAEDALQEAYDAKRIKLDLNGHNIINKPYNYILFKDVHDLSELINAFKTGIPLKKTIALNKEFSFIHKCCECSESIEFETDGVKLKAIKKCILAGHPGYVDFEINVPSGKMVVGNDFRKGFKIIGNYDIMFSLGIIKTIETYAEIGLAHGFVGNSCPSVFKFDNKTFSIGNKGKNPKELKGTKCVADICTDLWWYSIADYDEWVKRYEQEPKDTVVNCKPGVYKFRHYLKTKNGDWNNYKAEQIYCEIKWVRKPDPVNDLVKKENEKKLYCWPNYC